VKGIIAVGVGLEQLAADDGVVAIVIVIIVIIIDALFPASYPPKRPIELTFLT
jgi:hypothetical protein